MSDENLPRVTEILEASGVFPDRRWLPESALARGEFTHRYLEYYDRGILDETEVDPEIAPRLVGWKRFLAESQVEILAVEERVENALLRYRGRLDRRVRLNGRVGVLDIKNGAPYPWHALQTAAYGMCLPPEYLGRWSLYLDGEGNYRLHEHQDRADLGAWKSCVSLFHWKRARGIETAFAELAGELSQPAIEGDRRDDADRYRVA